MTAVTDAVLGPLIIVVADIIVFYFVGRLGKRSSGTGPKYEPFTGGEGSIAPRGLYRSNLFIFAALFLVVEALALILAGSFEAPSMTYPLLFLLGAGSVLTVTVWWFISSGGGEF